MTNLATKTIQKQIDIHASKESIWKALLDDQHFRDWCSQFMPGSYIKGDWIEGNTVYFLGPDPETGQEGGMVSKIVKLVPLERIEIHHIGVIVNGQEVFEGPDAEPWIGHDENYWVTGGPQVHTLHVETSVPAEHFEMFDQNWTNAVQRIREIAESL
jgi:hypothetical protein